MNELLKRLAEIDARQAALLGSDDNHVMSDEERQEFDALETERAEVEVKITQAKADKARRDALIARTNPGRRSGPANPGNPSITVHGPAARIDQAAGFASPREFLMAVMTANAGRIDERLHALRPSRSATAGSDEHGEYTDGHGGFLIPTSFLPGLMSLQAEGDPTAGRTTRVPMATPRVGINARTDKNHTTSVSAGLRMYRRAETQSVTASRMETEQVWLEASAMMGVSYATEEILQDSPISFVAILEQGFQDEYGATVLNEKLRGTGAGQYEGILNCPATVQVDKEDGQSADTILYANLVNMRSRLWRYGDAIWLYNHDCLPQLMNLADDNGRLIWQTSVREGEPDLLLGRPAMPTEAASTLGDKGDLILGNWSQYLEGELGGGVQRAESMHVRFLEHERAFRFMVRNAGKVWWRVPLTPKKSAKTLSPFVVLEAR